MTDEELEVFQAEIDARVSREVEIVRALMRKAIGLQSTGKLRVVWASHPGYQDGSVYPAVQVSLDGPLPPEVQAHMFATQRLSGMRSEAATQAHADVTKVVISVQHYNEPHPLVMLGPAKDPADLRDLLRDLGYVDVDAMCENAVSEDDLRDRCATLAELLRDWSSQGDQLRELGFHTQAQVGRDAIVKLARETGLVEALGLALEYVAPRS